MDKQKKKDLIIIFFVIFIPLLFGVYFATEDVNKEIKKNELDTLLKKARSSYNVNNFDSAINNSNKVLNNISPDDFPEQYIEAQEIIGDSYYSLSQYDKSFEAYEKILKITNKGPKLNKYDSTNSHISDVYKDIGVVYQSRGNYSEAINAYDNAIEINPQNSKAWVGRGTSLKYLGNYNEATKAYDNAIEINPQDSETAFDIPLINSSATPTLGNAPLTVNFIDNSTGSPTSWEWSFGDGTTSTRQNPTHIYSKPGVYTVEETVNNEVGTCTETKIDYIKVTAYNDNKSVY